MNHHRVLLNGGGCHSLWCSGLIFPHAIIVDHPASYSWSSPASSVADLPDRYDVLQCLSSYYMTKEHCCLLVVYDVWTPRLSQTIIVSYSGCPGVYLHHLSQKPDFHCLWDLYNEFSHSNIHSLTAGQI